MTNADYVLEMFDWNRCSKERNEGLKLSSEIKCINVFFQPLDDEFGKNVWGYCAKAISLRTDNQLRNYLFKMLEWIQDMNWPGAETIYERLLMYSDIEDLMLSIDICLRKAEQLGDLDWATNLKNLKEHIGERNQRQL